MDDIVSVEKKPISPDEIFRNSVKRMSHRQLSNHLHHKLRKPAKMIDQAWAVILSTVFDNTRIEVLEKQGNVFVTRIEKPGRISSGLQ